MDGSSSRQPILPSLLSGLTHILLHAALLALCILCLIALFDRASVGFIVFLVWVACFYLLIFILAWKGIPRVSILSVFFSRLRATPRAELPRPATSTTNYEGLPFPGGPYGAHPPYRGAHDSEYPTSLSHAEHTAEDFPDDDDDEERQRQIEEEISRRDVTILTVPRRKLRVINATSSSEPA